MANDPEPFDDIAMANSADLIDISLWAILKGDLTPTSMSTGTAL